MVFMDQAGSRVAREMAVDQPAGAAIDSVESWKKLVASLPEMLEQLLASEAFHVDSRPPADQRGIYLFSEAGEHLYVGRTGITARSRAQGGVPTTSFRYRFDQHTQPGSPPGASSFAKRLMLERAAELDLAVPACWWGDRETTCSRIYGLYKAAKTRIRAMECRVVSFEDDIRGVRSTVAEVYAHVHLRTPYNDFSTS
jgi:hypothetical protein